MLIKQGNKEFFSMEVGNNTHYYVATIDGKLVTGRQGSYPYIKCDTCGKIIGTQFKAHLKHFKSHSK